jgi:predicted O-methyltransferase YrrM
MKNFDNIMMKTLDEIAKSCNTDKSSKVHDYCRKYEKYLQFKRESALKILEIGVFNGSSLRMWKDYYPQSQIIGIDIDSYCKQYDEDRITIEIGSQIDLEFLKHIMDKYGPFDMILDDGSHMNSDVIYSFEHLFESVKSGGVYIIEDTAISYWPEFGGGRYHMDTIMEYFKNRIDEVNFFGEHVMKDPMVENNIRARKDSVLIKQFLLKRYDYIGTDIESINFLNSIILITKR